MNPQRESMVSEQPLTSRYLPVVRSSRQSRSVQESVSPLEKLHGVVRERTGLEFDIQNFDRLAEQGKNPSRW
jgi:hypothetical protein